LSLTSIAFILVFLTGCALAFVRHPIWGAALYLSTFFIGPSQHWWGQGALADIRWAYIAATVTLLALLVTRKAKPPAIPLMRHGAFWLMVLFTLWLAIQYLWALDPNAHFILLDYYFKFTIAMALIYRSADSEESLKILLWTQFGCCFYLGTLAYRGYEGGRFEDFGGAGLAEANAAALALAGGVLTGASLFLAGRLRERLVVLGGMPFIVNGIVTTISRSSSLALLAGGLIFNLFTPRKFAWQVRLLSVPAVILFLMLAGPAYWLRMGTLSHAGEHVAQTEQEGTGEETGQDRLEIIKAQWRMFARYPLGCGATCTAVLSSQYLEERYLSGAERQRASHNTFMTMMVEHGIPGIVFYVAILLWTLRSVWRLARRYRTESGLLAAVFPGVVAVLGSIFIGDLFVSYARFEVRYWFLAMLMAMLSLETGKQREQVPGPARATGPGPRAFTPAAPRAAGVRETPSGSR
jgi:O-antigen ligase